MDRQPVSFLCVKFRKGNKLLVLCWPSSLMNPAAMLMMLAFTVWKSLTSLDMLSTTHASITYNETRRRKSNNTALYLQCAHAVEVGVVTKLELLLYWGPNAGRNHLETVPNWQNSQTWNVQSRLLISGWNVVGSFYIRTSAMRVDIGAP